MDIGVVSKQSGLPVSTLRYYEEKGLIRSIGRNGLRRVFDETVLERLALIALGRQAGFSLNEILSVFTEDGPKIDREQLLLLQIPPGRLNLYDWLNQNDIHQRQVVTQEECE